MIEYDSIKIEATNYVELTYFKLNSYSIINLDTTNAELECDISFSFSASFSGTDINDEWFDRDNHYWHLPENQDYTIEDTYDSTAAIYAKVDLETERIIFSVGLINNGKDLNIFESFKN